MVKDGETLGEEVLEHGNLVQTEHWYKILGKDGNYDGRIHRVSGRLLRDIRNDIVDRLEKEKDDDGYSLLSKLDYFHVDYIISLSSPKDAYARWPDDCKWIACYAVTGRSEGHYIHVCVVSPSDDFKKISFNEQMLFLGKTFEGMKTAQKIANFISDILGA